MLGSRLLLYVGPLCSQLSLASSYTEFHESITPSVWKLRLGAMPSPGVRSISWKLRPLSVREAWATRGSTAACALELKHRAAASASEAGRSPMRTMSDMATP